MAEKLFDIVGVDSPDADCAVTIDKLPESNKGARPRMITWQGGGNVATGLVASARLGGKCAIMAKVGDDDYGIFCKNDFEFHGIDTSRLQVIPGATTSMAIVLSDLETQGRSIMFDVGSVSKYGVAEPDAEMLSNCKWFYLPAFIQPYLEHIKIAKAAGAKIFVDVARLNDSLREHIADINVFVASEEAYEEMFGDSKDFEANLKKVRAMGPEIVIFTLGGKGLIGYADEDGFFQLPAFKVDVRDTLGAGDVFHGAYVELLVLGYSPKEAARIASGVSAIKCTRSGGRAGIPDLKTVLKFVETGEIDYTEIDERVRRYGRSLALPRG